MKTCRSGHAYAPTGRRGCPVCAKARALQYRLEVAADPERAARKRKNARDYTRSRRAADAEFRARTYAHNRASALKARETKPEIVQKARAYQREYHKRRSEDAVYVERRRENTRRLRNDEEYRARELEVALQRDRARSTDPAFVERKREYMKERFKRDAVRTLHRINGHKRRARLAGAFAPGVTEEEWLAVCAAFAGPNGELACAYCRACGPVTIDHVVPIARGGADVASNVVPACKRCNSSKRDRLLGEWHRLPLGFRLTETLT